MENTSAPRRWLLLTLRFIIAVVVLFPLIAVSTCFVVVKVGDRETKEPGFGRSRETFPLVVLVPRDAGPGHDARLIEFRELHAVLSDPRATLLVPRSEEANIREQIDRLSPPDSDSSGDHYFESSLEVEHLSDGRQRIHVVASKYDDSPNESGYIASARGFTPEFHREYLTLGQGGLVVLTTFMISIVLTPILALLIVWRWARKNRPPS
jgi:hypothetical protein